MARRVFFLDQGKTYSDIEVCGGGEWLGSDAPCRYAQNGRFPGIRVHNGEYTGRCLKNVLGPLSRWQGHGGMTWPPELLSLMLFKCQENFWFVVEGVTGKVETK